MQKVKVVWFVGACIALYICLSSGCAGVPAAKGCHPGQHVCQTDAECEDEEAYLLDMDEGSQR